MVYIRIKKHIAALEGEKLVLAQVADIWADASLALSQMPMRLPSARGVWPVDALQLILQMQEKVPGEVINVLGDGMGWLHRAAKRRSEPKSAKQGASGMLRLGLICLAIFALSALAIFATIDKAPIVRMLWGRTIPIFLGVLLAALLYHARIGKRPSETIAEKLDDYRRTQAFAKGGAKALPQTPHRG